MWWCCAVGGIFSPGIFRQKRLGQIFLRQRQDVGTVQYAISCRIHFPRKKGKRFGLFYFLFFCAFQRRKWWGNHFQRCHMQRFVLGERGKYRRERNEGRLNFLCPDVLQTRNTDLFFAYMRILAFRTKCSTFTVIFYIWNYACLAKQGRPCLLRILQRDVSFNRCC